MKNLYIGDISGQSLGDSLSAGLGLDATSIFGISKECRGKAFDIGGTPNVQALPSFFSVYNPNVKGMSTKTTFYRNKGDKLNVAVSGDTSADLMNQKYKITKQKPTTKELRIEMHQTDISLKERIEKIVKESRERRIDSHINIGSIEMFSANDIANAGFKYLLFLDKCLFVECTESDVHETAKIYLSESFSSETKGGSRTGHTAEMSIPYHHKHTCGAVQNKYMDACLYVIPKLVPIVAGEVGYKGQTLVELCRLLANYLVPSSTIEVAVGLWISPNSLLFKAKIFILGRKLNKSQDEIENIKNAVEQDDFQRYADKCVRHTTKDFFKGEDGNNKFDELDCELLDEHDFSQANLDTDFIFEMRFTGYSGEIRNFKIKFEAVFKEEIYDMWLRENPRRN